MANGIIGFAAAVIAIAALAVVALPQSSYSQTSPTVFSATTQSQSQTGGSASLCNALFTSNRGFADVSNLFALNSLIALATALIGVMLGIMALAWAIGSAFHIDKLTRFAKVEMGEIVITAAVVYVFLGTFSAINIISGPSGLFALGGSSLNVTVFQSDCNILSGVALNPFSSIISLITEQNSLNILSSIYITFKPGGVGFIVAPLSGLSAIAQVLSTMINVSWGILAAMLALSMLPAVFYYVFPFFLFAGVVLRSTPFTRAAGGAFIALFASFYIVFPLLLYYMLTLPDITGLSTAVPTICFGSAAPVPPQQVTLQSIGSSITFASPSSYLPTMVDLFKGYQYTVCSFVLNVIVPSVYAIIAVVLSLLTALDFVQYLSQLLGAPSMQSKHVLRNVI
ncbi:MAG: hypothetical protein KGH98_00860 [Candidatus Micrarchaeota archaeon]|nr:hypothetical protein [Candidatus Micrarchaeota archaeon]